MGCSAGSFGCIGQYVGICRLFFPLRKAFQLGGMSCRFSPSECLPTYLCWVLRSPRVDCKQAPLEKREGKNGHFEEMAPPIKKNQAISPSHAESEWITQGSLSPLPRGILCMFIHWKGKIIVDFIYPIIRLKCQFFMDVGVQNSPPQDVLLLAYGLF